MKKSTCPRIPSNHSSRDTLPYIFVPYFVSDWLRRLASSSHRGTLKQARQGYCQLEAPAGRLGRWIRPCPATVATVFQPRLSPMRCGSTTASALSLGARLMLKWYTGFSARGFSEAVARMTAAACSGFAVPRLRPDTHDTRSGSCPFVPVSRYACRPAKPLPRVTLAITRASRWPGSAPRWRPRSFERRRACPSRSPSVRSG